MLLPALLPRQSRTGQVLALVATVAAGRTLALGVSIAHAQPAEPALELAWQAPADCPTQPQVLARVHAHVPALRSSAQHLQAFASVSQSGSKYALVLALRGRDLVAQKHLEVDSCEAAADAAALLIALALDPSALVAPAPHDAPLGGGEPSASSTPEPSDASAPTAAEPPAQGDRSTRPAVEEPRRDRPAPAAPIRISPPPPAPGEPLEAVITLGTGMALDVGMLPQEPAWGVRPWVGLSLSRLRVAAALALWLPGRSRADRLAADVEAQGVGGDLSLGLEVVQSRLLLAPYAVAELLALKVWATGISDPGSAAATWAALGPGLHGSYRLTGELRVFVDSSALVPLWQVRWLVRTGRGDVAVHATPAATFRACLGLAYVFR